MADTAVSAKSPKVTAEKGSSAPISLSLSPVGKKTRTTPGQAVAGVSTVEDSSVPVLQVLKTRSTVGSTVGSTAEKRKYEVSLES
jgi:hypothetical protein